jgi:hypothetical protein
MAKADAMTPDEYIAALPAGRREAIAAVREVVRANLPPGYEEGLRYGMIGWYVPLERFSDTYNGQPLGLAGGSRTWPWTSSPRRSPAPQSTATSSATRPCGARRASCGRAPADHPLRRLESAAYSSA